MSAWQRLGRLPPVPVVATYYAVAVALGLAWDGDTPLVVIAIVCGFAMYGAARASNGLDLFLLASAPAALSVIGPRAGRYPAMVGFGADDADRPGLNRTRGEGDASSPVVSAASA